jgi:autotransporter-associated beta strand protein
MRAIGIRGRGASNRARRIRALLAGTALSALTTLPAAAIDATWLGPLAAVPGPLVGTLDFDAPANWAPGSVPTGIATFGGSGTPALSFSTNTTVGAWTFNASASNYTFTNANALTFNGAGIAVFGGSATINNNSVVSFSNSSTAGSATITNSAGLTFLNSSTAANATITNNTGAITAFSSNSSAGSATIFNNGTGIVRFLGTSTGGNATLVNNNAAAQIDISGLTAGGLATGSIEGSGQVLLGSKNLGVGLNNLSTDFSGVISGTGDVNKFGTGTLTLSGGNIHTGFTGVTEGTLLVAAGGSIASSNAVVQGGATLIVNGTASNVNVAGTLSGTGTVQNVQIGSTAIFAPGSGVAGSSMTVANGIIFQPGATYRVQVSPTAASSASVSGIVGLAGTVNAQFAAGTAMWPATIPFSHRRWASPAPPSTRSRRAACLPASPPAWATPATTCRMSPPTAR